MEELRNVAVGWLSILMLIQIGMFMLSASDGVPMMESYVAAWTNTLRAVGGCFVPAKTTEERTELLMFWAAALFFLPGAILVVDVIGRMAK
ncbi:hypothetical protein [Duganella vulcania]|uniref:Uncharacterized protein n=1 Tax=Duganella vulcania TaxID=2692166 RepID=A0A845GGC1_9BURK|nr:hypothetical protein [Duganella vulcania]MYM92560.1 hypothetical protein [Duganella vulcania]